MHPRDIRKHLKREPFEPFRVHMSYGSFHDVRHPEMMFVGLRDIVVATRLGEDDLPDRTAFLDPIHVTRIEPLNGNGES